MDFLKTLRYPGRCIALGMDGGAVAAIYGVTGRSAASQARRYVREGSTILAKPVSEAIEQGNRDLLIYPAFMLFDLGFVVANGNQILKFKSDLAEDLKNELPEPDKYLTPRITGAYIGGRATLHIARASGNEAWDTPLQEGAGCLVSTYEGDVQNPTPFLGEPRAVKLGFGSAARAAEAVYGLLAPEYRVSVIAVYWKLGTEPDVAILNTHDLH